MRRLALPLLLGAALATALPHVALGANPCRVRNVDQATSGGSLKAMAAAANDGDLLRVRGVCRGEVVVSADVTIRGVGDVATITGQDERRVLRVQPSARVTIHGLVIRDGRAPGPAFRGGGGIRNRGDLTIIDTTVRDNRASSGGLGGGILNLAELVVFDSTIRHNGASRGGGIDSRRLAAGDPMPTLSIGGTRILRNRAVNGGGIHNMGSAFMEFSEVDRNRAGFGGGGIANVQSGDFDIQNTNIRDNTAGTEGGGIANDDGVISLVSVVFDGNDPNDCIGSPDCS